MPTRDFISRLKTDHRQTIGEILRFGIVGTAATLLQYLVYWICLHWFSAWLSLTVGYVVSFVFNFFASSKFTFRVEANARHGAGFLLSHVVNYLLQTLTLHLFIWLGVSEQLAPIPMFCVCVPVNFVLVRYFLKR